MASHRAGAPRHALPVAVALVLVGLAAALFLLRPPQVSMELFLSPHPDDEMQAWAILMDDPSVYTVFVTLTHGEATGYCEPDVIAAHLRSDLGERAPEPMPMGRFSAECAEARVHSWVSFLDGAATVTPAARIGPADEEVLTLDPVDGVPEPTNPHATLGAANARAWVGPHGARVALDLGDGNLEPAEVEWAVKAILALRGEVLPEAPLAALIGAAYTNDLTHGGDLRAYPYVHSDHAAVTESLNELAEMASSGSWLTTHPFDPAATHTYTLSDTDYGALMGLAPDGGDDPATWQREGVHQISYGWLAFPHTYWATGELPIADSSVLFPQRQTFRHVPGSDDD